MGGNVIPQAAAVTRTNFKTVKQNLQNLMPEGITIYPIGSAGKKDISSDMDVLIDAAELMKAFPATELKFSRKALEDYFKSKGLLAARTGVSIHVGIPTGENNDVAQVDVMAVDNAQAAVPLHTHDYSKDAAMKGGTLHAIWADLANLSSTPEISLMMSPYKGLVNRTTKELITANKDEIAKKIIGPTATAQDMGSVDNMLNALKPYPSKYAAIRDKYAPGTAVQEGSREWFRNIMDCVQ